MVAGTLGVLELVDLLQLLVPMYEAKWPAL